MKEKRYYVIANPNGGAKNLMEIIAKVKPVFDNAKADLMFHATSWSRHAYEIARDADLENYDGLIAIGGDGTVHETITGLMERSDKMKIPLGIIPAGSGNSFLWGMNIHDPIDAARRIIRGGSFKIDVAKLDMPGDTLYSFNMVGWGLVTKISATAENYRWWPKQRYNIATIIELIRMNPRKVQLEIDGELLDEKLSFVIGCNTPYTGVGMKMAPKADLEDGKIDLVVVKKASRLQMLKLFPKVFNGSHIESDLVDYYQAKSFRLITDSNDLLNIDGEITGGTPLSVKVLQHAVEIFI